MSTFSFSNTILGGGGSEKEVGNRWKKSVSSSDASSRNGRTDHSPADCERVDDFGDKQLLDGLANFRAVFPRGIDMNYASDIPAFRRYFHQHTSTSKSSCSVPDLPFVESSDHHAPALRKGAPDVLVRLYQPTDRAAPSASSSLFPPLLSMPSLSQSSLSSAESEGSATSSKYKTPLPALLWMHGGGYVFGSIEADDTRARSMALGLNCVVVSVEYRLAPEHPYPAALEDCHAALHWLVTNANEWGIDKKKIAVGGACAGGGLAAALGLLVRDKCPNLVQLRYQLLLYPLLDDRNIVDEHGHGDSSSFRNKRKKDRSSSPKEEEEDPVVTWTATNNRVGWEAYLGHDRVASQKISHFAAPYRARDVSGLPPTYVGTGSSGLVREENVDFALRLMSAGVRTELHVFADGYHAFDVLAPLSQSGKRFHSDQMQVLRQALHG